MAAYFALCFCLVFMNLPHLEAKIPEIAKLHIKSDVKFRFASTLVTSKVVNTENVAREALFNVTLPNEAFITKFKLNIDGKVIDGEVKEKEVAKQQFERAQSRGQSAGIIKTQPREANKFKIKVNVAASSEVTFFLTYQELLRRKKGKYNLGIYFDPGQVVKDFQIKVDIQESRDITKLIVPKLKKTGEKNDLAKILRPSPKKASITYRPTEAQQTQISAQGLQGQFVVEYDVKRDKGPGDMMLVNGYFVHYFAPEGFESFPMDVVFVLDKSGSMSGPKIRQLREAMNRILDDMRSKDRLSIITFDSSVSSWKNELIFADRRNIEEAKRFSDSIVARGGTDINQSILKGLATLSKTDIKRAPVLIFLTDGQATSGETNRDKILKNIETANEINVPIFSLAFGERADYDFVKKISGRNNGFARKIYEDSDPALQIKGFYEEISTVLMRNVNFDYVNSSVLTDSVTKDNFNTYFEGTEIVVAGKMRPGSKTSVPVTIKGAVTYGLIDLVEPMKHIIIRPVIKLPLNDKSLLKITEKLWAYLTIKQLLRKKEASTSSSEKSELDKKILKMSLKYQFVTPLTSMVVTLPEKIPTETVRPPIVTFEDALSPVPVQARVASFSGLQMSPPVAAQSIGFTAPRTTFGRRNFGGLSRMSKSMSRFPFNSNGGGASIGAALNGGPSSFGLGFGPQSTFLPNALMTTMSITTTTMPTTTYMGTTTTLSPRVLESSIRTVQGAKLPPFPTDRKIAPPRPLPANTKAEWRPNFFVKINGILDPLCMDLNYEAGATYKLLEDVTNVFKLEGTVSHMYINSMGQFATSGSGGKVQMNGLTRIDDRGSVTINPSRFLMADSYYVEIQAIPAPGLISKVAESYFQLTVQFRSKTTPNIGGLFGFFKDFVGRVKLDSTSTMLKFNIQKGTTNVLLTATKKTRPRSGMRSCWYIDGQALAALGLNLNSYKV